MQFSHAVLGIAVFLVAYGARAQDESQREAQSKTAQMITLAELAPLLCPDVEADDTAIRDLEEQVAVSEQDVRDPTMFGVQDELVARNFTMSFKDKGVQTCADIAGYLGPNGAKLLRRKSGAPG